MARKDQGPDHGRVKVRVIEFEMDANNSTLKDSIRDIVGAIGRGPQVVRAANSAAVTDGTPSAIANDTAEQAPQTNEETIVIDAPDEVRTAQSSYSNSAPKKPRRHKTPKIVDVELREGSVPLKGFLQEYAPEPDSKKYTLIAYWYKKYRDIAEVTADHIYTAYRELGWSKLQPDVSGPFRALKKDGLFESGTHRGSYALNHIGEGKALDMLKKSPK